MTMNKLSIMVLTLVHSFKWVPPSVLLTLNLTVLAVLSDAQSSVTPRSPHNHGNLNQPQGAISPNELLEITSNLTADKIKKMSDADPVLAELYCQRLAGADPSISWVGLIDHDILHRATSSRLLLTLVREPRYPSNRASVFEWVAFHPNYHGANQVLELAESMFKSDQIPRDDLYELAEMTATVGDARHLMLFESIQRLDDGTSIQLAKARFQKRLAEIKRDGATSSRASVPAIPSSPAPESQRPSLESSTEATSIAWTVIVAMIAVALGLLWLLHKRRS